MITALLRRTSSGDAGTFGILEIMGHTFHTGELPDRGNAEKLSSIPAGVYDVKWTYSPHFKRDTYEILNVPDREGVRIHIGNHCGDITKGLKSDVEGCSLLGMGHSDDVDGQPGVTASGDAIREFESMMAQRDFQIAIVDEYKEAGASDGTKTTV